MACDGNTIDLVEVDSVSEMMVRSYAHRVKEVKKKKKRAKTACTNIPLFDRRERGSVWESDDKTKYATHNVYPSLSTANSKQQIVQALQRLLYRNRVSAVVAARYGFA